MTEVDHEQLVDICYRVFAGRQKPDPRRGFRWVPGQRDLNGLLVSVEDAAVLKQVTRDQIQAPAREAVARVLGDVGQADEDFKWDVWFIDRLECWVESRRSEREIIAAYKEMFDKVWYCRSHPDNKVWVDCDDRRRHDPEVGKEGRKRIEDKYGRDELREPISSPYEYGRLCGRLEALGWVMSYGEWGDDHLLET